VFALMLHVDYGLPAYPPGELVGWRRFEDFAGLLTASARQWRRGEAVPAGEDWELLGSVLWYLSNVMWGLTVWDVAVLFYLYYTHRTAAAEVDWAKGWTGYTGVLQEMIAKVATRGTDRLERKLSLDVHYLIPECVQGWERQAELMVMAMDVARRYGCRVVPPKMPEAPAWWKWYDALAGLIPFRQSLPDEEKGEVLEKLLGGRDSGHAEWDNKKGVNTKHKRYEDSGRGNKGDDMKRDDMKRDDMKRDDMKRDDMDNNMDNDMNNNMDNDADNNMGNDVDNDADNNMGNDVDNNMGNDVDNKRDNHNVGTTEVDE